MVVLFDRAWRVPADLAVFQRGTGPVSLARVGPNSCPTVRVYELESALALVANAATNNCGRAEHAISPAIDRSVIAAASKVRGVEVDTLRTSMAPQAFSFVLDGTQAPAAAVAGFRKAIGDASVQLTVVRIMRDGVLIDPN